MKTKDIKKEILEEFDKKFLYMGIDDDVDISRKEVRQFLSKAIDKAVEEREREIRLIIASYSSLPAKHTKYLLNEIKKLNTFSGED